MFMPNRNADEERQALQAEYRRVENICLELLPADSALREASVISVQEVVCGDPECAPIDTSVTIMFPSGGQGFFGLPMECKDITMEDMKKVFPPPEIVTKWFQGIDTEGEWPPEPEPVELRFPMGTFVLCRVGPTNWAPGTIVQQWYREANWQPGMYAPYKIRLDDGRDIFAPQDMDQVIRLNPNKQQEVTIPTEGSPESE